MRCPNCGRSYKQKRTKQLIKEKGMCGICLRGNPKSFDTKRFSRLNSSNSGVLFNEI